MPVRAAIRLLLLIYCLLLPAAASAQQTPYQDHWFDANHPKIGGPGGESVDPLTGSLNIVTTDLVLPGNAGFSLPITRWYSSQIFPGIHQGSHTLEPFNWAGYGWRLHFGKVTGLQLAEPGKTVIELPLGGGGLLYRTTKFTEGWMTKSFIRYSRGTHTALLPNGHTYKFGYAYTDGNGVTSRHVTEITDAFNNRVTFEYFTRTSGEVIGVSRIQQFITSTQIREVTFTITSGRTLATMSYNGRTWRYEHTSTTPRLTRVWYPGNTGTNADWAYSYGGHAGWELTQIRYPQGGTISYTYTEMPRQAQGAGLNTRVVIERRTGGQQITAGTWTFQYDQTGNKDWTFVVGPTSTEKFRYWGVGHSSDFAAWIKGSLRDRRLEVNGVLVEREQRTWLQSERVSFDPIPPYTGGTLWADGSVWNALIESRTITRGTLTWTTNYNYTWGAGNVNDWGNPVEILEGGERTRRITRVYVPHTSFTRHLLGRVSRETLTVGTESAVSEWRYGNRGFVEVENIRGVQTTYTALSTGNVAAMTDANGNQTSYEYDWGVVRRIQTPHVLTTRTINPDGTIASETVGSLTTSYTYDALGRVTRIRPPGYPSLTAETEIVYTGDPWQQLVQTIRGGSESRLWFDGFGRSRLKIGPDGVRQRVTRDAEGRVTFATYPHTSTTNVPGTTTTYDGLGRPLTVTAEDGSVRSYGYLGGNDVEITDAQGRKTTYTYEAAGHPGTGVLVSVKDATNAITTYSYNGLDQLTRVNVPGVPERRWNYDSRGCLSSEVRPESGTTTYQRDAVCNTTQITDAAGQVFTLTYDGNHRLTNRNAPGTVSDLTINYDSSGRVTSQSTPGATTTFTYDAASRPTKRADMVNGVSFESRYAFNTLDQLTTMTYPSGAVAGYAYDSGLRLAEVTYQGTTFADQFAYAGSGKLTSVRTGVVVHTLAYDTRQRVRQITAGGELDLTYAYDRTGNVLSIADPRPGESQAFTYDALTRLASATGSWGQLDWTYDAAGNRLTESGGSTTTYTYSASTQRLTSTSGASSESFSYDAIGRLSADGRGTYTYTPTNRLASAITPAGSITYSYTPDDGRVLTVVNGTSKYTVRGAAGQVLSEFEGTTWKRDLVYAGSVLVGAVKASGAEYYATDALGSMRVVFDAAGTVVARSDYLPFGEATNAEGDLPAQRFTGQERDEEGGLDYFNARMYQPRTGRFTAVDPVSGNGGDPQSWNGYAYVRNNPLRFTDPSGMCMGCPAPPPGFGSWAGYSERRSADANAGIVKFRHMTPNDGVASVDEIFDSPGYRGGSELNQALEEWGIRRDVRFHADAEAAWYTKQLDQAKIATSEALGTGWITSLDGTATAKSEHGGELFTPGLRPQPADGFIHPSRPGEIFKIGGGWHTTQLPGGLTVSSPVGLHGLYSFGEHGWRNGQQFIDERHRGNDFSWDDLARAGGIAPTGGWK